MNNLYQPLAPTCLSLFNSRDRLRLRLPIAPRLPVAPPQPPFLLSLQLRFPPRLQVRLPSPCLPLELPDHQRRPHHLLLIRCSPIPTILKPPKLRLYAVPLDALLATLGGIRAKVATSRPPPPSSPTITVFGATSLTPPPLQLVPLPTNKRPRARIVPNGRSRSNPNWTHCTNVRPGHQFLALRSLQKLSLFAPSGSSSSNVTKITA